MYRGFLIKVNKERMVERASAKAGLNDKDIEDMISDIPRRGVDRAGYGVLWFELKTRGAENRRLCSTKMFKHTQMQESFSADPAGCGST